MNPRTIRLLCVCFALVSSLVTRAAPPRVNPELQAWQKKVFNAIGTRWYREIESKRDLIAVGTVRLTFRITSKGRVKNLKIRSNTSNEASANICINAIVGAKLPPIPKNVVPELAHDWLELDIPFTIFAK